MTAEEAIARARAAALAEGWVWAEPAKAEYRPGWFGRGGRWEVWSLAGRRGTKARIVIDDVSGAVIEKGHVAR